MKFQAGLVCLLWAGLACAQDAPHKATLDYIHGAWANLTRTSENCAAYADIKVTTQPVLYLPADVPTPAEAATIAAKCGIRIAALPRKIDQLGDVRPEELAQPGLLYLPHPYVVPGGRFNEMYGWDSFFIILGLEDDHRAALAKDMVENFLYEVEHYGSVLNANRSYYLTRAQPPLLSSMIRAVMENPESFAATAAGRKERDAWLKHAFAVAAKDHATWERPEHRDAATGLDRYWDYGVGPVPEMADDATYYPDVIRWLVAHPGTADEMLVKASENPTAEEAATLRETSCDIAVGHVCKKAWAEGYRLTADYYRGDRAMRESGYDASFRFAAFSGATHHFAPVCLNAQLYRYERDMEHFAHLLGLPAEAAQWKQKAAARAAAMQHYLWQPQRGEFADYDLEKHSAATYPYVASFYPMWAGVATPEEARQMVKHLATFERKGGLSMSTYASGLQWDEPLGWAPAHWFVVEGLQAYGYKVEAKRIAEAFLQTADKGFARDGTLREKYNVTDPDKPAVVSAGYKANGVGFGWTNGVYLEFVR